MKDPGDLSVIPKQNASYCKYQARHNWELLNKSQDGNEALKDELRRL